MLNSRPLSCVYTKENCEPITPSHLLLGQNLQGHWFRTATGDENVELNLVKCKKRYNHLLKLINDLWKQFKKEYLSELREQQMYNYRRYSDAEKLVLNDMELIKDDDITPRNKWKKGPNGHSTSNRRRYVEDLISTNFHVISTYFFDIISLIEKSTSFSHTFFDVISMVEISTFFPRTFFYVISMSKKSMLFPRTFFDVISLVEKSTLFPLSFC